VLESEHRIIDGVDSVKDVPNVRIERSRASHREHRVSEKLIDDLRDILLVSRVREARREPQPVQEEFLLDVVVKEGAPVLKLFAIEDKTLLIRRDTILVMDLRLHIVDGVGGFNIECDGFGQPAGQGLDENLHPTPHPESQVQGGLLLDAVVREGARIFEMLASEDKKLLVRRDTVLELDLSFHVVDGVRGLNVQRDAFLDGATGKPGANVVDGVRGVGVERDIFPRQGTDENLHSVLMGLLLLGLLMGLELLGLLMLGLLLLGVLMGFLLGLLLLLGPRLGLLQVRNERRGAEDGTRFAAPGEMERDASTRRKMGAPA